MFILFRTLARLCVLVLVCLAITSCEDNTIEPSRYGALEGVVLDSRTNAPLASVVITTSPATSSFTTDAQGKFSLPNLATGKYTVTARKTDYTAENANVTVEEGTPTSVTIVLDKASGSNRRPNNPFSPTPADKSTGQVAANLQLKWRVSDPDGKSDSLRNDVILYESNSTDRRLVLSNSRDTTVAVTDLKYNTTYYWQVTVRDKAGEVVRGDIWSFQTSALPDNRFLYVREVNGNTDIYSSDNAGGALQRLTSSAFIETAPQLSPNRDRIAYTSNVTGQFQLYTMNRDGSDARRVSVLSVDGYNNAGLGYHWSPDGSQLIYAHYNELYRINRDGTGLTLLATAPEGRHFRECDWTAQGNRIVVQTVGTNIYDSELYLMNADGSNRTLVQGNAPGRLDSPTFSIDGRQLLYTRDVAGFDNATGRQLNAHVFLQNLDGSGLTDLSAASTSNASTTSGKPAGTNDLFARFSPDGSKVIFVNSINDNLSAPEVWTMDLDGRNRTRLFQNATLPDWR
ncbi:carboxypeptidase regulatory-like domain-containing protein [Hymenobacter jejuensis]|nr:carboxypeptidase regulatory-like domain-containing protein [Hymenobacter jejuensis]